MTHNALVVGCGTIGSKLDEGTAGEVALTHASGYEMHTKTELVAGVDPDSTRLETFSSSRNVPGYTDIETALSEHDIDIVSVCTPQATHRTVIDSVLTADIEGILCEKPLAGDSEVATRLASRCQSMDVTLAVNYFRRYLPGCQIARAMLHRGVVGIKKRVVLTYNKGFLNNGSHVVDLARWWFGNVTDIETSGNEIPDGVATFGQTSCHLVHAGSSSYNHIQVDVYGDRGRLQLLDQGGRIEWRIAEESPLFNGFEHLGTANTMATGLEWMCYFVVDDLVAAVEESRPPACDGDDAVQTLKLCERFLR